MAIYINNGMYGDKKEETYIGCVLNCYERNGYHDSDFYATVWDEQTKSIKDILFDTTRCGGSGYAKIDATKEIRQKAKKYDIMQAYKDWKRLYTLKLTNQKIVKVVKGRKVKKGLFGKIVKIENNVYDEFNKKVLLLIDNINVWTYENNLEIQKPDIHQIINARENIFNRLN